MLANNIKYTIPEVIDFEGDGHEYSYSGLTPSKDGGTWVTFENDTFDINPLREHNGSYTLDMFMKDGVNLTDDVPINLVVTENKRPRYQGDNNFTVSVGKTMEHTLGSDVIYDEDPINSTFYLDGSTVFPDWFELDESDYTFKISNLTMDDVGTHIGTFTTTDICPGTDTNNTFKIIIIPNLPVSLVGTLEDMELAKSAAPIFIGFPDPLFNDPEDNYSIEISSSILQGSKIKFNIFEVNGNGIDFQASPTFVGIIKITVKAVDDIGQSASTSFKITVSGCKSDI
jgi:hypothetical protein